MPKKARKRRSWTKTDVRKLKALAKRTVRAANIASALKRSEGATRQKAFTLGWSLDTRARTLTPRLPQPGVDQAIGL
jgi:hypothetical protein